MSLPLRHVLIDPPRRPWTNIRSTRGSADECSSRRPLGPACPVSVVLAASRRFRPQVLNRCLNDMGWSSSARARLDVSAVLVEAVAGVPVSICTTLPRGPRCIAGLQLFKPRPEHL